MIYSTTSPHFRTFLAAPAAEARTRRQQQPAAAAAPPPPAPVALAPPGVLSAHNVVVEFAGVQVPGPHARFVTQRYLRYALVNREHGLPPQDAWHTPVGGAADRQTAAIAEEADGSLSKVIDSLKPGDRVEIEDSGLQRLGRNLPGYISC